MRGSGRWYPIQEQLEQYLPELRPAQQGGLARWVYGALLAQSACQTAVVTALSVLGEWQTIRQGLREVFANGKDKAAPCQTQIEVTVCFAGLLRWVLAWWQGDALALAVDATLDGTKTAALVISVLYRGAAIPVAWHILPASQKGAWLPPIVRLLRQLRPAVPSTMQVLVLTDRGLWSPHLWRAFRACGWHPVMRIRKDSAVQPLGLRRQPAQRLVSGVNQAWVGRVTLRKDRRLRRKGTLIVLWLPGHDEPSVVFTDLAPEAVGICWYGMRFWIELGFRALKGVGFQWQNTRRTDPDRVARYWLVLAIAMLWTMAYGTRVEDAELAGIRPEHLRQPPTCTIPRTRRVSVFAKGLAWLRRPLQTGRYWTRLWLRPAPWPDPPPGVTITLYQTPTNLPRSPAYLPL
jgi:hypothetical protein